MIQLKLTPNGKEQELIKQYLENNVSEMLADKINNGVKIVKENKTLINKKDLNGFMKFANSEARKLAEKGANYACVEDKTVFGWAIHYFEEDSIEGTLYNEDGTEYKAIVKTNIEPKVEVKQPPKQEKKQASLFDFMDLSNTQEEMEENEFEEELEEENLSYKGQIAKYSQPDPLNEEDNEEWSEEDKKEAIKQLEKQKTVVLDNRLINAETGEVIKPEKNKTNSIDKELAVILYNLLDGKLEVK